LKVDLQELEPCVKRISITIPLEDVEKEKETAYREIAKSANIPGFRKGHTPRSVLKKMYEERIHGDVAQRLVSEAYQEVITSNKLRPVGDPKVEEIKLDADAPLTFSATLEVMPEVTIEGLDQITLDRSIPRPSADEIDSVLAQYQERHARFEPIADRGVAEGDYPMVDYRATHDGAVIDAFKGENRMVEMNKEAMLPDVYDALLGMTTGEEKEFDSRLPDDFPEEKLQGKPISFYLKVNEIKVKNLPALDDEFAKEVSEFDTIAEVRTDVENTIIDRARETAKEELRNNLLDKLLATVDITLPPALFERQTDAFYHRAVSARKQAAASTKTDDDTDAPVAELTSEEEETLKAESRGKAERELKEQVIVGSYGTANGIEVGDREIDAEIARIAPMLGQSPATTREQFDRSGALQGLATRIFTDKVYEKMMTHVTLNDQIVEG
jgi:trigger factor